MLKYTGQGSTIATPFRQSRKGRKRRSRPYSPDTEQMTESTTWWLWGSDERISDFSKSFSTIPDMCKASVKPIEQPFDRQQVSTVLCDRNVWQKSKAHLLQDLPSAADFLGQLFEWCIWRRATVDPRFFFSLSAFHKQQKTRGVSIVACYSYQQNIISKKMHTNKIRMSIFKRLYPLN